MSAESTPTREETVLANIANVLSTYNKDAHMQMISQCVQDISVSLAKLVDAGSSSDET